MPDETPMMGIMVRAAVEAGEGAPVYIPIDMGDHMEWEVRFRNVDGSERPVLVRTGGYKRLKTAKALVNYHLSYFPDVGSVTVPVIPGKISD